jgi:hypothetical protein
LSGGLISSFGEDHNRELYVLSYSTGSTARIYRFFPLVPLPPAELALTQIQGSFALDWSDESNNELGFIIERSLLNEVNYTVIDSVDYNTTTYTDVVGDDPNLYTYRIRSFNDAGESSYAYTEDIVLGVWDNFFEQVKVFPNPSPGQFFVELPQSILPARMRVFNLLKQEIYSSWMEEMDQFIDLQCSAGIYMVELQSYMGTSVFRISVR